VTKLAHRSLLVDDAMACLQHCDEGAGRGQIRFSFDGFSWIGAEPQGDRMKVGERGDEGIGAAVRRREDLRFLSGRGRYTDDLHRAGEAHGVFIRSPHAHAEIVALSGDAAAAVPGFVALFTGADMASAGVRPMMHDLILHDQQGKPIATPPRLPLATSRVRYVGEPVALAIGESLAAAMDLAEAVEVEYRELPAIVAAAEALLPSAPLLWPEAPGNLALRFRYGDAAATERGFAGAHRIVKLDLVNQRIAGNPMEARVCIGAPEDGSERLVLWCSHQAPHQEQAHLAHMFGLSERDIRVVSYDVGGGFGIKGPSYPEEAAVLWAASRLRRPVRWRCERSEAFLSDAHARDHATQLEMAVDESGRFLALRIRDVANLGAYLSSFGAGPPVMAQATISNGPYLVPAVSGEVRLAFTNTVPTDAYRGAGRPENTYMIERLVDCVAHDLGLDPAEIRRRNLVPPEKLPYRSPLAGRVFDSGDFPGNLRRALELADHAGLAKRRDAAAAAGRLLGFGLSTYIEQCGIGPSHILMQRGSTFATYESAAVRVKPDGSVTVLTGTHTHGQGLETAFAQIVAERLGVGVKEVEVRHGDTDLIAAGRGTVGSRSLLAGGAALDGALAKVIAKGKRMAADILETAEQDIEFADGRYRVAGSDREIGFREVAREAYYPCRLSLQGIEPGLEETAYWDPKGLAFPNGAHACEVEIDRETGVLRITRYVAVDDFGVIVNPLLAEGQVHGGVAQGLGQALCEALVYDDGGQLVSGSFMDYTMPRADLLPAFDTAFNPHPCSTNPLGVKGAGESGTIAASPALVNAAVDALRPLGVRHIDMPLTPEKIWRLMRAG
jgi:carbon-monoxide dehydrogenase large subunit